RAYIFPILAKRMPQFKPEGDHLKEHQEIHKGLDEYIAYIKKCRKSRKDWDGEKMKNIMDSFRDVLFKSPSASLARCIYRCGVGGTTNYHCYLLKLWSLILGLFAQEKSVWEAFE